MTTTEHGLQAEWAAWHAGREDTLREPHGWLSLIGLDWLDGEARAYDGLPGTWRAGGDGGVEISATAADGLLVDGSPVDGTLRVEPVDGAPGVLVTIGHRRAEVIRRTDSYAVRVRDPQARTRTSFEGVPAFPVDERWVVDGRYEPFAEPRAIVVGAVVEELDHHLTAVGIVRFTLDGTDQELVALPGKTGSGLLLHFQDATSGTSTYGGGRGVEVGEPDDDGRVTVDFNRTINLPCVFTEFATCPLPPAENRLAVPVEAGELAPPRPDLR